MPRLARTVSLLLHPFVTAAVAVAAGAVQLGRDAAGAVALVSMLVIAPVAALIVRQVARAKWENSDASNPRERPVLFLVSGAALVVLLSYLLISRPQSFLVRGAAGALAMLAVCAAVTPWIKVSLHLAFASLAATVLIFLGSPVGWLLVGVTPLLAWSRLELSRHRPLELVLGAVAGILSGLGIHWF